MRLRGIRAGIAVASVVAGAVGFGACVGSDPASSAPVTSGDAGAGDATESLIDGKARSDGGAGADAETDAGIEVDASGWSPKSLPGLALWLDNADGLAFDGTAKLSSWLDKSGNGNNGTAGAPCLAPSRAAGALNGRDTVAFATSGADATCIQVADSPILQFGTGDLAVFLVARCANTANSAQLWAKRHTDNTGASFLVNGVFDFKMFNTLADGNVVAGASPNLNDSSYHRFGTTRRGLDIEVWLDGVRDGANTLAQAVDVSKPGRAVFIGANATSAPVAITGLVGNVAEVVAVKGTLSDAQIAQLDAYFKAKHGL